MNKVNDFCIKIPYLWTPYDSNLCVFHSTEKLIARSWGENQLQVYELLVSTRLDIFGLYVFLPALDTIFLKRRIRRIFMVAWVFVRTKTPRCYFSDERILDYQYDPRDLYLVLGSGRRNNRESDRILI
jgi:hypothetical protein